MAFRELEAILGVLILVCILVLRNFGMLILSRRMFLLMWVVVLLVLTSFTVLSGGTNGLVLLEGALMGMVPVIRPADPTLTSLGVLILMLVLL